MSRNTTPTTVFEIPRPSTNFKCDVNSVAEAFNILCGVEHIEKYEPETFKKLNMWSKLLIRATDTQLEKILTPQNVRSICELLVGVIGEFRQENLTEIFQHAVMYFDDAVHAGKMKEGNYKSFCDISMWMLNLLKTIDSYNEDPSDFYDIAFVSRYIKYKGHHVIELYIYKAIVGTF
jgi:hypothetical protein